MAGGLVELTGFEGVMKWEPFCGGKSMVILRDFPLIDFNSALFGLVI